jgi:pilus assembly protein CpaB
VENRNLILALVAIVVAGIAVLIVNSYLSGMEERAEVQAEEQRLARIVVASQPLAFGDPLTRENIRLQNFPAGSVPQGAFTSIERALADNRVALRPIVPGEPVLADKVSGADGRAVLSANLPDGMRAVSVPITAITGVSGFVRPGDTVDVLLTRKIDVDGATGDDLMSDVILERVQVLAIDQVANEKDTAPKVGRTAVLQVDLLDAQKLAVATRVGTLSLALRNVDTVSPVGAQTVTTRDLGDPQYYYAARSAAAARLRRAAADARAVPAAMPPVYAPGPMPAAAAAAPVPVGPRMTVYRGTTGEDYPVSRLGGR